jgi:hypothetical protein
MKTTHHGSIRSHAYPNVAELSALEANCAAIVQRWLRRVLVEGRHLWGREVAPRF